MKKNICFFCGSLSHGGAERVISILSHKFAQSGYNVDILLYYDREIFYSINEKVKIHIIEKETGTSKILKNYVWLRKYMSAYDGCVLSFLAPFNMLALVAHIGLKNKLIVADRNDPRRVPSSLIMRRARDFLYNFSDGIVVQTKNNKEYFSRKVQGKTAVIYNPVELGEYSGKALSEEKRKEIVSVGRLNEQKNQSMLIDAFARFHTEHPEYQLTIYGEGPLKGKLKEKIDSLNLADAIQLPGNVKNLFPKITGAEIFALSSMYEGMPNALIEAMCLGLPVVSTKVSGATDLIESGANGLLVDMDDINGLLVALKQLAGDKVQRESLAKAATELNEMLSVDEITKQWIRFIEGVCN